ncbi:Hypothetical protein PENO1_107170 [Penicillium occitanis (nom. inval.)]|nr:Hypothetical protein PENO1_107170 [Penicillium occitanis (nom. inval.)]PCG89194.1 hypothetical protein PENOC_107570 [Penicillium occitanis (nom. inval.)]
MTGGINMASLSSSDDPVVEKRSFRECRQRSAHATPGYDRTRSGGPKPSSFPARTMAETTTLAVMENDLPPGFGRQHSPLSLGSAEESERRTWVGNEDMTLMDWPDGAPGRDTGAAWFNGQGIPTALPDVLESATAVPQPPVASSLFSAPARPAGPFPALSAFHHRLLSNPDTTSLPWYNVPSFVSGALPSTSYEKVESVSYAVDGGRRTVSVVHRFEPPASCEEGLNHHRE